MGKVRVRFAPSPTGYVHVGNARTALFNWLFAHHHGGVLILRIEDTDVGRSEQRYESQLLDDLRWFGLDWAEGPDKGGPFGPYRQSERHGLYQPHTARLIEQGRAYYCFCSAEQLEAERQEALNSGRQPGYSGRCRTVTKQEAAERIGVGETAAIRLRIDETVLQWNDLVHGESSFPGEMIGDPILVRSDGNPAYNFAVVIDDHLMEITHVIRGDDHISNTPRQLALYHALGWEPPAFAHLSTILGSDRTRLSKRHGATSLESFRKLGILPEALRNYLALLGWSPADGKTEILRRAELVEQFSLEHVIKSPAVFDQEKLNWMNRHYLKQLSQARLVELSIPFLVEAGLLSEPVSPPVLVWVERVVDAVINKIDCLSQLPESVQTILDYDARAALESIGARDANPGSYEVLGLVICKILAEPKLSYGRFREIVKEVQQATGKKGRELFHPVRVALTGSDSGPELEKLIPIFETGSDLPLVRPVKSVAERLREFASAAHLF